MIAIKDSPLLKHIFLSIKLGNPQYECARYGICEMDADGDFYLPNFEKVDKRVRAIVSITKKKQLSLLFDRNSLTARTDKEHFGSGFFTIEVAKALPVSVSDKLGIKPSQIEMGMYSISANQRYYKIVVALKPITVKALDCGCSKQKMNSMAVAH
jgi:hypothetical protein